MRYCFRFPLLLNTSGGCNIALDFRLQMTLCTCFFGCESKLIFHSKAHLFIFARSLFSSRVEVLLSWITENKGVSSAYSFAFENNSSDKSLAYIRNNNRPSTELWGTPALTSNQSETCPFNKTFYFLFLRKSHITKVTY